jgi:hypothetical protein
MHKILLATERLTRLEQAAEVQKAEFRNLTPVV